MRTYLSSLLLCFSCCYQVPVLAQWQTGWALDPHAGINGVFLQPAASSTTPYNWDVNLIGLNAFAANDYAFISNASALSLLRDINGANGNFSVMERGDGFDWHLGTTVYSFDYLDNGRPHFGRFGIDVLGPSFSLQVGEYSRVGLFSRVRGMATTQDIDADFSYYPYEDLPEGAQVPVDEVFAAAALWSEVGGHFSTAFAAGADGEIRVGLNLRYLTPFDAVSVYNPPGSVYGKVSLDSITLTNAQTEIAFTNGISATPDEGVSAGNGFAADLGLQYAWESMDGGGFRYNIGLSFLDLGRLSVNKTAQVHSFASEDEVVLYAENFEFAEGQEDLDAIIDQLNRDFFNTTGLSQIDDAFTIGLPPTFSAQFNFRPTASWQFSAAYLGDILQPIRSFSQGQQLTFATHFSRWWYGAGLSASLYQWRVFNLGLQVRLGPLVLGTDRLIGTALRHRQLTSGDFFFALKIHDFGNRKRKKGRQKFRSGRGRSKNVQCYDFR